MTQLSFNPLLWGVGISKAKRPQGSKKIDGNTDKKEIFHRIVGNGIGQHQRPGNLANATAITTTKTSPKRQNWFSPFSASLRKSKRVKILFTRGYPCFLIYDVLHIKVFNDLN
jgi:hypothetical protein